MLSSQARTTNLLFDEPRAAADEQKALEPKQLVSATDLIVRSTSSLISERRGALAKGSKVAVIAEVDVIEHGGRRQRRALVATHHIHGEPVRLGWVTSYKAGSATLVPPQLSKPPVASPWRLAYSIFPMTRAQAEAEWSPSTPTTSFSDGHRSSFTRKKSQPQLAARSHYTPTDYFPKGPGAEKPKLVPTLIPWDNSSTTSVAQRVLELSAENEFSA